MSELKYCHDCRLMVVRGGGPGVNSRIMCRHKIVPLLFDDTQVPIHKMRGDDHPTYCGPEARHFEPIVLKAKTINRYTPDFLREVGWALLLGALTGAIVLSLILMVIGLVK